MNKQELKFKGFVHFERPDRHGEWVFQAFWNDRGRLGTKRYRDLPDGLEGYAVLPTTDPKELEAVARKHLLDFPNEQALKYRILEQLWHSADRGPEVNYFESVSYALIKRVRHVIAVYCGRCRRRDQVYVDNATCRGCGEHILETELREKLGWLPK